MSGFSIGNHESNAHRGSAGGGTGKPRGVLRLPLPHSLRSMLLWLVLATQAIPALFGAFLYARWYDALTPSVPEWPWMLSGFLLWAAAVSATAVVMGRRLETRLGGLSDHAVQMSRGKWVDPPRPGGPAELLRLAETLSMMSREMQRRQQQLVDANQRLVLATVRSRESAEEAARAADRIRAIQYVTEAALTTQTLDELLSQLLNRAREVLAADSAKVLLLSDDGAHLTVRASSGQNGTSIDQSPIPLGRGFAGRVAASRDPIIVDDLLTAEMPDPLLKGRTRSVIGAPLIAEGRVIGVLHAGASSPNRFDQDDLRLLQLVANHVGLAIERARLYAELDAAMNSIADGLVIYGRDGKIIRANLAAERILALTSDDYPLPIETRSLRRRLRTTEGIPFQFDELPGVRALRGETVRGVIMLMHRPDGRDGWLSVSAAPINTPEGRQLGAVATFADFTALHDLQEQREDLLRTVSHDLKTPLTVIQGRAQLLQRTLARAGLSGAEVDGLEAILTSARRMDAMIQDLVDRAQLESGQLRLHPVLVQLPAFLSDLWGRLVGVLEMERVRLELPPGLPSIWADPDRLERIITNLLTNAMKYSEPGGEVVIGADEEDGEVVVSVIDRGLGLATVDLPYLFDRFYRARGARRADGLGPGLYITRMLVEAQGGRIWVESEVGQGSVFRFTVPTEGLSEPEPQQG
jgi:signal transduction histidine kinase/putative methionine-R-sulfoxide reductase with GAF domain